MKYSGTIFAICAIFLSASSFAAETAVPGAMLFIYNMQKGTLPPPNADPVEVTADTGKTFSRDVLAAGAETRRLLREKLFMVWKGYISVPEDGEYTLSMSYNTRSIGHDDHATLFVDGKSVLEIASGRNFRIADARSLPLSRGAHEIAIVYRTHPLPFRGVCVSLAMWNRKTPFRKMSVTPRTMTHAE